MKMNKGLKPVSQRRDDAVSRVKWDQLEVLLADHYRSHGYEVDHCGTGGTRSKFDGGVDLRLRRGGELFLVQAKHWNAYKVAHNDVHQLLGLVVNEDAVGGILITSGEFTKAAIEAAARQGRIQLIDGEELREMLGPLPDEALVPAEDDRTAAPVTTAAGAFAANAAERLVAAAEDRIRHRGSLRRTAAKSASHALILLLVKLAFAGLVMILLLSGINKALDGIQRSAAVRSNTGAAPAAMTLPAPTQQASVGPQAAPSAAYQAPTRGIAEIGSEKSEAERREWRRRNAEAMRILEETTPEIPLAPPSTHSSSAMNEHD